MGTVARGIKATDLQVKSEVEPAGIEPATSCLQKLWLSEQLATLRASQIVHARHLCHMRRTALRTMRWGLRTTSACPTSLAAFGTHIWYPWKFLKSAARNVNHKMQAVSAIPPAGLEPAISCVKGRRPNR
jgi:hypothetical protein